MNPILALAIAAISIHSARAADESSDAAPRFGTWGFDLSGRDLSVKPGDKLYLKPEDRVKIW